MSGIRPLTKIMEGRAAIKRRSSFDKMNQISELEMAHARSIGNYKQPWPRNGAVAKDSVQLCPFTPQSCTGMHPRNRTNYRTNRYNVLVNNNIERSAKPLFVGSTPTRASTLHTPPLAGSA